MAVFVSILQSPMAWSDGMPEDGAAADTGPAKTAADNLPEGTGRAAVMKSCVGACHGADVFSQTHTAQEWASRVDEMIGMGANVADDDYVPIIVYLATHFSPKDDAP